MSKQSPTRSVFDRLADLDEPADACEPAEPDESPGLATPVDPAESDSAPDAAEAADDAPAERAGDIESDPDEAAAAVGDGPPGRRRRRVLAFVVGAVVVAALGSSGYLGWRVKQFDDTEAAGHAALETARNYAVILTTLDAKDIDKNYQQALDGATGQFKDEYSQGSTQLRQLLIDNGAAGKGMVIDSAIRSATKTKVEVLLFVDQSVTNAVRPSPRIDRNRVMMTMELVDHRWLASKVEII